MANHHSSKDMYLKEIKNKQRDLILSTYFDFKSQDLNNPIQTNLVADYS